MRPSELLPHYFNLARTLASRWRYTFCCDCRGARARSGFPTTVADACSDFPLLAEQLSWLVLSGFTVSYFFRPVDLAARWEIGYIPSLRSDHHVT